MDSPPSPSSTAHTRRSVDERNLKNTSTTSAEDSLTGTTVSQGRRASTGSMIIPNIPSLNASQIRQYMHIADKRLKQLTQDWHPRPFTSAELLEYRADTHTLIGSIKKLEAEKERIFPLVNGAVETNLFMARVDYRIKFSRIFRFNDLPTEITCNIFRFVVWSNTDYNKSIQARLHVTWVCTRWRKIAIEDTTLWTVIWWKDGPRFLRSKVWLNRSGNAPKDIRISDNGEETMDVETVDKILQRIIPRISTVRALIIVLRSWDSILYALDQLRAIKFMSRPMILERFEMHRSGAVWVQLGPGYQPYREPMPLFGGVAIPTLRTLSLSAVHVDWAQSPLSNLTTLDIRQLPLDRAPSFDQFRAILSSSPMLTKLILDSAGPNYHGLSVDEIDFPPIPLHHLKSLAMADFSPTYGVYLLSHISAPGLRDLTLLNMSHEDYSPFYALMTGKMPDLRVLTIFNGELYPTNEVLPDHRRLAIVRWLESMPKITFLRFGGMRRSFLETFLCNPARVARQYPENRVLCPNLTFLEWQRMDYKVVLEWAQYRKRIGIPLKKMYVNFDKPQQPVDSEIRKELTEAMDVGGEVLLLRPGHKAPEESNLQR